MEIKKVHNEVIGIDSKKEEKKINDSKQRLLEEYENTFLTSDFKVIEHAFGIMLVKD